VKRELSYTHVKPENLCPNNCFVTDGADAVPTGQCSNSSK
jgi:hypothetical protein